MMRRSTGDGVGIALAIWEGKGKTVFCVHGIAANCRTWDTMATSLAPKYPVLAMDLRGRGFQINPLQDIPSRTIAGIFTMWLKNKISRGL